MGSSNLDDKWRSGPAAGGPFVYLTTQFIQAKEYFEAIVASTSDAIVTTDLDGRVTYFSPGAEKMFGMRALDAMGLPAERLYARGHAEAARIMKMLYAQDRVADYETTVRAANGRRIPVSMSAALLRDRSGSVIGTLGISKDISRRVELERKLREMSNTDNLTGLYNQRCFRKKANSEVQRARRQSGSLSVLVIDLDNFKEANDQWGHLEGDNILSQTATILKDCIRENVDTAFRYGGDEFIVILPGLGKRNAEKVAKRIREASSRKPYSHLVTLSVGVATLTETDALSDLIRRADTRMYGEKRKKKRPKTSRRI